jgi:hypothetical protein
MLYGTAKVFVEHIAEGLPYSQVKKVYFANIIYFDLGQGDEYGGISKRLGLNK